jgi:xanthine dehydrogenase small subunit
MKSLQQKDYGDSVNWLIQNKFIPKYFRDIPSRLSKIKFKKQLAKNTIMVAGGTDLYVQMADQFTEQNVELLLPPNELSGISFYRKNCVIGAMTTVSEIFNNNAFQVYFPKIQTYLKLISSEQIRNMATLAGNFVNASPIGDMSIFFLALDSKLTIKNNEGKLKTIVFKHFFKSYKEFDLKKNETIVNITFEVPDKSYQFNFEKVSKRTHLDIASVNSAIKIKIEKNLIKDVHIAVGGVSPIPKYLHETNAFLREKPLAIETLKEANSIMQEEIAPITDIRGSSTYKRLLSRQLLFAHFINLFPEKFNLIDLVTL